MTLLQFEIFVTVISEGSFTKAGEKLCISQSAVSHAIAGLEEELGVKIIHREKRGIRPTEFGKSLLTYMTEILEKKQLIIQEAATFKNAPKGNIKIGAPPSMALQLLHPLLPHFKEVCPLIEITVCEGSYEELERLLVAEAIDLAFIIKPVGELEWSMDGVWMEMSSSR